MRNEMWLRRDGMLKLFNNNVANPLRPWRRGG